MFLFALFPVSLFVKIFYRKKYSKKKRFLSNVFLVRYFYHFLLLSEDGRRQEGIQPGQDK